MLKNDRNKIFDSTWEKTDNGLFLPRTYLENREDTKTKKGFIDHKNSIANNLSLILLIPSLLGAIWQITELVNINIAYIRFFSISQIPTDGALILFMLMLILIFVKIISFFSKVFINIQKEEFKNKSEEDIENIKIQSKKLLPIKIIIIFMLLVSSIVVVRDIFLNYFTNQPIFSIIVLVFITTGISIYTINFSKLFILEIQEVRKEKSLRYLFGILIEKYNLYIGSALLIAIISLLIIMYIILKGFSSSFLLPANLYNTKNLESTIYKDFKTKDYSIEYFNDKYIFVQLCAVSQCQSETDKKIVIYPTDKALFKSTQQKVQVEYITSSKSLK